MSILYTYIKILKFSINNLWDSNNKKDYNYQYTL
jgi:hypothetical protein